MLERGQTGADTGRSSCHFSPSLRVSVVTFGPGACAWCTHGGGGIDRDENDTLNPPKWKEKNSPLRTITHPCPVLQRPSRKTTPLFLLSYTSPPPISILWAL